MLKPEPSGCGMRVVYEDEELLVFDKPSGLPSTAHQGQESGTAIHHALAYYPELPGQSESLEPGLLHRLDTGTSGALAFAKTQSARNRLRSAWKCDVQKTYRAIVAPSSKQLAKASLDRGIPLSVCLDIAHDGKSSKRMRVLDPALEIPMREQLRRIRGKPQPARTEILRAIPLSGECWDLEIRISTGVMHQIRAHLAHLGYPLVGDAIYRGRESERLWLHAWKLTLSNSKGQPIDITAPLPPNWPTG